MTSQQILQSDLLDILFEKRNKLYGAYLLRRHYNSHLIQAVGATALLVLLLLFFVGPSTTSKKKQELTPLITVREYVTEHQTPQLPKPPAQQKIVEQKLKQDIFITRLKLVNTTVSPVTTQDQLLHTNIGTSVVAAPFLPGIVPPDPPSAAVIGTDRNDPKELLPSRPPQFPGGADAWIQFLNTHLRPPQDLNAGEKHSCVIRFSVDEEGVITNFQVLQSGGAEFDNEVIRVLKKMPKWLPALQNGKPMAVSFSQPVTFIAAED
jgi:protein TonB